MFTEYERDLYRAIEQGAASVLTGRYSYLGPDAAQEGWMRLYRWGPAREGLIAQPAVVGFRAGVWAALNELKKEKRHSRGRIPMASMSPEGDTLEAEETQFSDQGRSAEDLQGRITIREALAGAYITLTERQKKIWPYVLSGSKQVDISRSLGLWPSVISKEVAAIFDAIEALLDSPPEDPTDPTHRPPAGGRRGKNASRASATGQGDPTHGRNHAVGKSLMDTLIPKGLVGRFLVLILQLPAFAELRAEHELEAPRDLRGILEQLGLLHAGQDWFDGTNRAESRTDDQDLIELFVHYYYRSLWCTGTTTFIKPTDRTVLEVIDAIGRELSVPGAVLGAGAGDGAATVAREPLTLALRESEQAACSRPAISRRVVASREHRQPSCAAGQILLRFMMPVLEPWPLLEWEMSDFLDGLTADISRIAGELLQFSREANGQVRNLASGGEWNVVPRGLPKLHDWLHWLGAGGVVLHCHGHRFDKGQSHLAFFEYKEPEAWDTGIPVDLVSVNEALAFRCPQGLVLPSACGRTDQGLSLDAERGLCDDEVLFSNGSYQTRVAGDIAVLAVYQTALGKEGLDGSDGMVGPTHGLRPTGAAHVCSSLWNVNDQTRAELLGSCRSWLSINVMVPAAAGANLRPPLPDALHVEPTGEGCAGATTSESIQAALLEARLAIPRILAFASVAASHVLSDGILMIGGARRASRCSGRVALDQQRHPRDQQAKPKKKEVAEVFLCTCVTRKSRKGFRVDEVPPVPSAFLEGTLDEEYGPGLEEEPVN